MSLPGFTGEVSLLAKAHAYVGTYSYGATGVGVLPQMRMQDCQDFLCGPGGCYCVMGGGYGGGGEGGGGGGEPPPKQNSYACVQCKSGCTHLPTAAKRAACRAHCLDAYC